MTIQRTADIPPTVRTAVILRCRNFCEECGERKPLEMHHLTYRRRDHDHDELLIFGHETPDDLLALCRDCHHAQHVDPAGVFWEDPEEMEAHWFTYHEEMGRD